MKAGADREIEALYRESLHDLRHYLGRWLTTAEAAEDVAQEAYLKMLTLDDVNAIRHPRAYLFRMAGRLALNYLRQSRRKRSDGEGGVIYFDEHQHNTGSPGPEKISNRLEELALVSGAIEAMPEKTRIVFEQHRFKERSYGEIAEQLNISKKTVEYHMSKAIEHLMFQCGEIADLH